MLNDSSIKVLSSRKTLSDVLSDLSQFKTTTFNLIESKTGTGKTYAAVNKINQLSPSKRILYLIDTVAGKNGIENDYENIISYDDVESYDRKVCEDFLSNYDEKYDNIAVVMTYAKFGYLMRDNSIDLTQYGVIICDEMQSLMDFMDWDLAKARKTFPMCKEKDFDRGLPFLCLSFAAFKGIVNTYNDIDNEIFVVAITASARAIKERIKDYLKIELDEELEGYKEEYTTKYTSKDDIPYLVSQEGKTLIYMQSIKQMKLLKGEINKAGKTCECLWSPNSDKELSNQQERLRHFLTEKKCYPKALDVLIINYAYHTSININDANIDTVIIHSKEEKIITQARGRVRHDIKNLYIFDSNAIIVKPLPEKYLNKILSAQDKNEIKDYYNIRSLNGTVKGFPHILSHLPKDKYKIERGNRKLIIKEI